VTKCGSPSARRCCARRSLSSWASPQRTVLFSLNVTRLSPSDRYDYQSA